MGEENGDNGRADERVRGEGQSGGTRVCVPEPCFVPKRMGWYIHCIDLAYDNPFRSIAVGIVLPTRLSQNAVYLH